MLMGMLQRGVGLVATCVCFLLQFSLACLFANFVDLDVCWVVFRWDVCCWCFCLLFGFGLVGLLDWFG